MIETTDDIWEWHDAGHWLVVPTNIGWKSTGHNVMGRGVAMDAALRFPELPSIYGNFCKRNSTGPCVQLLEAQKLIMFPTKPLDYKQPHLSWKNSSSLEVIERSMLEFIRETKELQSPVFAATLAKKSQVVVFPLVGCGNGNLSSRLVLPLLRKYLVGKTFVLCLPL